MVLETTSAAISSSLIGEFYAFGGVVCIVAAPFAWLLLAYAGLALRPGRRLLLRALAIGFFLVPILLGSALIGAFGPSGERIQMAALATAAFVGAAPVALIWTLRRRTAIRREARAEGRELPSSRRRFDRQLLQAAENAVRWRTEFDAATAVELEVRGWVGSRFVDRWAALRPDGLNPLLTRRRLASALQRLPPWVEEAVDGGRSGVAELADRINEAYVTGRLLLDKPFLDTIERSPLTEEQARAVLNFDDRVRVIASAGSGKTSTIVAKAAYAVSRGLASADRILVLTFNRETARELQQRIASRFAIAGLDAGGVRAQTFHAFGLETIGAATGRKPSLARWVDQGREIEVLAQIVAELRANRIGFGRAWDLYRTIYSDPSGWESDDIETEQLTLSGHRVRSFGERVIADFLWTNAVTFEYEKPYIVDTADAEHGQYRPDFYYPDADLWHEHWAFDAEGRLPSTGYEGYADAVRWKRATHEKHGTRLLETRFGDVWSTSFLSDLGAELQRRGLVLEERFDRPSRTRDVPSDSDLLRQIKDFIGAVKSDSLDRDGLLGRVSLLRTPALRHRARLFIDLALQILAEWDARLALDGVVDFDDMMTAASELLESGKASPQFDLVLVDEFQDTSPARARLLQALLRESSRRLFAVGDDWQAINRFAGADLSVFTDFEAWFGPASTVLLQRTFRSSQPICDIAGDFVAKNPRQLAKRVRSDEEQVAPAIEVRLVAGEAGETSAAEGFLDDLQARMDRLRRRDGHVARRTVRILGRYNWLERLVPRGLARWPDLEVRFSNVHASKGLEADYVVVLGMTAGKAGFPSTQRDDPNIDLVRAPADDFLHADERRLFYVALTRARRRVLLITEHGNVSPFVSELVHSGAVPLVGARGETIELCPRCAQGVLRDSSTHGRAVRRCDRMRCDYSAVPPSAPAETARRHRATTGV